MFGLGTGEIILILLIVLVVFGGSRLPALGRGLGEGLRSFKDAIKGDEPNKGDDRKPADKSEPPKSS